MIRVEGLVIDHGGSRVVDSLDLQVAEGRSLALLGVSGSGKTSTALAIAGLSTGQVGGRIEVDGRPLDPTSIGRVVGFVFQEPALALDPVYRIGAQIEEVARRHGRPPRLADRLRAVGLDQALLARFPGQLSGGQQQRAAIAIALAGDPRVLIADEPTSALDSVAQAEVLELLDQLRRSTGLTLLFITHDRELAARIADDQVWMAAGRVVPSPAAVAWPARGARQGGGGGLEARGLGVAVADGWLRRKRLLDPLDLDVPAGRILGVVGASGSGKTTLGRALAGFTPYTGTLRLAGAPIRDRRRVQMVHQNPGTALDPRFTVGATLREAGGDPRALLDAVGLAGIPLERRQDRLSGGEKQRVAIARAIATQPDVLVLDEALSALDPDTAAGVLRLLLDLRTRHHPSLVFISHDLSLVGRIADRVVVLDQGRCVEEGPAAEVLADPRAPATQALRRARRWTGDRSATPSL